MVMWKEHFESFPPKMKFAVPLNLQLLDLKLKELPKELKCLFLGEGRTFPFIISSALDKLQESNLKKLLTQHKGTIG